MGRERKREDEEKGDKELIAMAHMDLFLNQGEFMAGCTKVVSRHRGIKVVGEERKARDRLSLFAD